jgi:hypothetical protein
LANKHTQDPHRNENNNPEIGLAAMHLRKKTAAMSAAMKR